MRPADFAQNSKLCGPIPGLARLVTSNTSGTPFGGGFARKNVSNGSTWLRGIWMYV